MNACMVPGFRSSSQAPKQKPDALPPCGSLRHAGSAGLQRQTAGHGGQGLALGPAHLCSGSQAAAVPCPGGTLHLSRRALHALLDSDTKQQTDPLSGTLLFKLINLKKQQKPGIAPDVIRSGRSKSSTRKQDGMSLEAGLSRVRRWAVTARPMHPRGSPPRGHLQDSSSPGRLPRRRGVGIAPATPCAPELAASSPKRPPPVVSHSGKTLRSGVGERS